MAQPKLQLAEVTRRDAAAALHLSEDDFSVRVVSADDPIFWVRVERDPADAVVVTDFNPGTRTLADLEAGLSMAIRAVSPRPFQSLVFRDLVPGGDQQAGFPIRLVRSADVAKTLANGIAAELGRAVTGFKIEHRNGKLDAVMLLGSR